MAAPKLPVLRFKCEKKSSVYGDFRLNAAPRVEYVFMHWMRIVFPSLEFVGQEHANGAAIASGYRCDSCKRVFFVLDEDDLLHECMEPYER